MSSQTSLPLDQFNQWVLACQEDAFTLAGSLLGDEALACKVVQEVILRVYRNSSECDGAIRMKVLQGVLWKCRQRKTSGNGGATKYIPGWDGLERRVQEALLLVDSLRKTYREAALILGCPEDEVARAIANGRRQLACEFSVRADDVKW